MTLKKSLAQIGSNYLDVNIFWEIRGSTSCFMSPEESGVWISQTLTVLPVRAWGLSDHRVIFIAVPTYGALPRCIAFLTLCGAMDCSPPGSSLLGIFQPRTVEWVAISYSRGSSQASNWTCVSCISCIGRHWATWEAQTTICVIEMILKIQSVQFSSVAQSCLTLCDPMNCSTPGLLVHHQLPDCTQTHVHQVGDAIQPSHPLLSPSPPALNLSQHQGLFQWVSSSHQVAKLLEFQLQHQSFQCIARTDLL